MKGWKYGQILATYDESGEPIYFMAELYPLGVKGEYNMFCPADFQTSEELQMAIDDIGRDGPNTWFYENGIFTWTWDEGGGWWDWEANGEEPGE